MTTFDTERISALINILGKAVQATPDTMPLDQRTLIALQHLPLAVVAEIGVAARELADMADQVSNCNDQDDHALADNDMVAELKRML